MSKKAKERTIEFWRICKEYSRKSGAMRKVYYVSYDGQTVTRVTSKEFNRLVPRRRLREYRPELHERKQKGRSRGKHAEIPGAGHAWPLRCEALAVHPKQVEQFNERNKKRGCNVRYEPKTGIAIVPDSGEYKRLRKIDGVHDNNGFCQ